MVLPDSIDQNTCGQRVVATGNPARQREPASGGLHAFRRCDNLRLWRCQDGQERRLHLLAFRVGLAGPADQPLAVAAAALERALVHRPDLAREGLRAQPLGRGQPEWLVRRLRDTTQQPHLRPADSTGQERGLGPRQPGEHRIQAPGGEAEGGAKEAIQTIPDPDFSPMLLYVDVADFLLHGAVEDVLHQPDHRCGPGCPFQVVHGLSSPRGTPFVGELFQEVLKLPAVGSTQAFQECPLGHDYGFHPLSALELDIVQDLEIEGVGHGQAEGSGPGSEWENLPLSGQLRPYGSTGMRITVERRRLIGEAELNGEATSHGFLIDPPVSDEKSPDSKSRSGLLGQGGLQLFAGHGSGLHQELAQDFGFGFHPRMMAPAGGRLHGLGGLGQEVLQNEVGDVHDAGQLFGALQEPWPPYEGEGGISGMAPGDVFDVSVVAGEDQ